MKNDEDLAQPMCGQISIPDPSQYEAAPLYTWTWLSIIFFRLLAIQG